MKISKTLLAAAVASAIISLIAVWLNYIPAAEREPNVYYSSIWESFIFALIYSAPILLALSITAYIIYALLGKTTRFSHAMKTPLSITAAVCVTAAAVYFVTKTSKTNDIYLIPEGFEGDVYAFYNVKGAPTVEREDGYEVHTVNEKGYYATSVPDMDYGTITDQYFYVDEDGKRTPISEKCVSPFGIGGYSEFTDDAAADIRYSGFRLTRDHCSDEFITENHGMGETEEAVIGEILKEYYNVNR